MACTIGLDLGTTTVDLSLHNLETGRRISRKTLLNRQTAFGADVISRAQAFSKDRRAVREAALDTIAEAAQMILDNIGSKDKEVLSLDECGHVMTLDVGWDTLAERTYDFIMAHVPQPKAASRG